MHFVEYGGSLGTVIDNCLQLCNSDMSLLMSNKAQSNIVYYEITEPLQNIKTPSIWWQGKNKMAPPFLRQKQKNSGIKHIIY